MPAMSPGPGCTTGRFGIRDRLAWSSRSSGSGEVLLLLDNETGMHSCLDSKPKLAGWRRRQKEASPWGGRAEGNAEAPSADRGAAFMIAAISARRPTTEQ